MNTNIPILNQDNEWVDHPPHYNLDGMEAIDIIRATLDHDEYKGFLKGNALKYLLREGRKNNRIQDVEKAQWYMDAYHDALTAEYN